MDSQTVIETEYSDFKSLKEALQAYAIKSYFNYKVVRADSSRYQVCCIGSVSYNCPFKLRAIFSKRSMSVIVKDLILDHSCPPHIHGESVAQIGWIKSHIRDSVESDQAVKPKALIQKVKEASSSTVPYGIAWNAREKAREEIHGNEAEAYSKLPSLRQQLLAASPQTNIVLEKDGSLFRRIFIYNEATKGAFEHCRKLVAMDGTFLKSRYLGTLLLAVALDANNELLLLAYAVVDAENIDNWKWFLQNLACADDHFNTSGCVILSDREKGLIEAVGTIPSLTYRSYCCQKSVWASYFAAVLECGASNK